jgi:hypothetical protein
MSDKHPSGVHDFAAEVKKAGPIAEGDRLFAYFLRLLVAVMACYGVAMTVVILWGPGDIGTRMVTGFSVMFGGVLGLGSGYLLGRRNGGNGG